jgi:hypothetical protein
MRTKEPAETQIYRPHGLGRLGHSEEKGLAMHQSSLYSNCVSTGRQERSTKVRCRWPLSNCNPPPQVPAQREPTSRWDHKPSKPKPAPISDHEPRYVGFGNIMQSTCAIVNCNRWSGAECRLVIGSAPVSLPRLGAGGSRLGLTFAWFNLISPAAVPMEFWSLEEERKCQGFQGNMGSWAFKETSGGQDPCGSVYFTTSLIMHYLINIRGRVA